MAELQNLIPIRWKSGPLEIAIRSKASDLTPAARQTIEKWHDPAALDMLAGSPINCLVVNWAAGLAEDAAQQRSIMPLLEAARRRNLNVVGWTEGSVDPNAAVAAAKTAGLTAIALQNYKGKSDFPVIISASRETAALITTAPALAVADNVWPGIAPSATPSNASAGPTGLPWLDSNGWYVRLVRAHYQGPLWMLFDPPKGEVVVPGRYANSICDTQMCGARWVISLDDSLCAGLISGSAAAKSTLQDMGKALAFFEQHKDWNSYRTVGIVGVISDFAGENFDMSGEVLNLSLRRDLQVQAIWKLQAMTQPFIGLKALVYLDTAAPAPELRSKIMTFVNQGGLLMTSPGWGAVQGTSIDPDFPCMFDVKSVGKGRVAVARSNSIDPWQVAVDGQMVVSFRHDLYKYFNTGSSGSTAVSLSPNGEKSLLQGLAFSDRTSGGPRTIWVPQKYRSATCHVIGSAATPAIAEAAEEYPGFEYHLPVEISFVSYLAMEFEI
jgi:hypothetical protein